jgi:hypothetical protein
MYGGLKIENQGVLKIFPFSTTLVVHNDTVFQDNMILQFPEIGLAAQPNQFDGLDAPDPSPRGNFTVKGVLKFKGGTLRGKSDISTANRLVLSDGTKFIRFSAKLIGFGITDWLGGDIVTSSGGQLLNLGTLQPFGADGTADISLFDANQFIQGSVTVSSLGAGGLAESVDTADEYGDTAYTLNYNGHALDFSLTYDEYAALIDENVNI